MAPLFPVLEDGRGTDPRPIVYGLVDPREPRRVRYVGQTTQAPLARYIGHVSPPGQGLGKRAQWLLSLHTAGVRPLMVLLEPVAPGADLTDRERSWIATLQRHGGADTNEPAPKSHRLADLAHGAFVMEFEQPGDAHA